MLAAAVAMALLCVARQTSPATTTHTNFPSFFPPFIAPHLSMRAAAAKSEEEMVDGPIFVFLRGFFLSSSSRFHCCCQNEKGIYGAFGSSFSLLHNI